MREIRSSGSVRGASGDGRPYRERNLLLAAHLGEGRFTSPTAAIQAWRPELVFMPLKRPCRRPQAVTALPCTGWGDLPTLASGNSAPGP